MSNETINAPSLRSEASTLIMQGDYFDRLERVASLMASGRASVPAHLQKNTADCFAIAMQAMRWNMDPFIVAQKTHLIGGVMGYEAQLVNAVINSLAPTKDRLHFEWFGEWSRIVGKFKEIESKTKKDDDGNFKKYRVPAWDISAEQGLGVRVWATMKGEDEPRVIELLMTQARTRNSPLWADDPKQQIAYLAIKRWSRLYCPDVIMGVYTKDELEDVSHEREINPIDEVQKEPEKPIEYYPDAAFEKSFSKWKLAVETGKSTTEVWINTLTAKLPLTDIQLAKINEVKAPIEGEVTE